MRKQEPIRNCGLPTSGLVGLWLSRGDFDFLSPGPTTRIFRLMCTAIRGFVFTFFAWLIFWPLSLAYLVPTYGGSTHIGGWGPPVFKAVYAGLLGMVTTPLTSLLALCEAGRKEVQQPEATVFERHSQGVPMQNDGQGV